MWHFECEYHTLVIEMMRPGEYGLSLDHRLLGSYPNPKAAAKDVPCGKACRLMGNCACGREIPLSLTDWQPGQPRNYFPE